MKDEHIIKSSANGINRMRHYKRFIYILVDIVLINLSYILAYYLRFDFNIPYSEFIVYEKNAILITVIYIVCFHIFKLYGRLWAYVSIDELLLVIGACITAGLSSLFLEQIVLSRLPYTICILGGIFSVIFIGAFRMSSRVYKSSIILFDRPDKQDYKRVMVVGAGAAGAMIIKEMNRHREMKYEPAALIDDNRYKVGTTISGVKVFGDRYRIEKIAKEKKIDIILIAIPSIEEEEKTKIINICKKTECRLKIMPGMYEIINDNINLSQIRDIELEDLLGRETVKLDMDGISDYIKDKKILITGGGGSIGSELCRQIAKFEPKKLIVLDIYENNAYDLQNELKFQYPSLNLKVIIASVRDKRRIDNIFKTLRPEVVFHAAAHKHVPLMEDNPSEAVKNNIFGTLNVSECADKYNVKRFVMISTDKAVNPTNVMGATKRVCEMIVQAMDKVSETEFVAVRFGNVLGSNGSVIPLFKRQIANGGPVTVTHKGITRFFMTIPEAAQLVLQAGAYAKGGEIFVLDMGKPVKIYDLACDLIRLSGFEPGKDIKIEISGLRPGEKLYEEVLMDEEGLGGTGHVKIFVGRPMFEDMDGLRDRLEKLKLAAEDEDDNRLIYELKKTVPTFGISNQTEAAVGLIN